MPDSAITKKALAHALKMQLQTKPLSKISIGDICQQCHMNRKSFYYHFRDKYDLVNWIFAWEYLQGRVVPEDPWQALGELFEYFYANRDFYRKVLRVKGQNSFGEYFHSLCLDAFCQKGGDSEDAQFCALFYADACICAIERWLGQKDCMPPQELIARLRACMNWSL